MHQEINGRIVDEVRESGVTAEGEWELLGLYISDALLEQKVYMKVH